MSKNFRDNLIGKQFERWSVLEFSPNEKSGSYWLCECSCELKTQKIIMGMSLKNGDSKSCGCLHKEVCSKDKIGKRFGKLLVAEKTNDIDPVYNSVIWKCICDCGKECYKSTRQLNKGAKSCGCLHLTDITNKKFGKLIALEPSEKRSQNGSIFWKCLCDCGEYCYVITGKLNSNERTSCGNCNGKDLLNQRFGKLVAIEKTIERYHGKIIWKCKCDCGEIIKVVAGSLISGNTKTCGCERSIGEMNIRKILNENNMDYSTEYSFDDLRSNKNALLRFDFVIFDNDLLYLIEFDGLQHEQLGFGQTEIEFEESQERDKLKNEYCIKNSIPLIRIPYSERDNITIDICRLKNNPYVVKK